jgi:hypothetical protein
MGEDGASNYREIELRNFRSNSKDVKDINLMNTLL